MKKILSVFLIFLFWFFISFNYVSATETTNQASQKAETKWIKTFIVKKSLGAISYALRNMSDDALKKAAKLYSSDTKAINSLISNNYSIASKIDSIAKNITTITTDIRSYIYNSLKPYLWHSISWILSNLLDLALL